MTGLRWVWQRESKAYGNYGNPNQWTVQAGMGGLAREAAQNSNDARIDDGLAQLAFRLIRLTGSDKTDFENALGWERDLRPHLEAMASESQVISNVIGEGLRSHDESGELVLLRVEDRDCFGLTGPEFPADDLSEADYGNFIKLCRLDLYSGKNQAAGGSFGLGKAVYWRFSRFQTVLFNSTLRPQDAVDGHHRNRLFGVNQGTVHRFDGLRYKGRGYFGIPDDEGEIASVWDSPLLDRLHLRRDTDDPGTSVLVVGFFDPDKPEAGIDDLAGDLEAGVQEHFWPLITRNRMEFRIEIVDGGRTRSFDVDAEKAYPELVHALRRFDAGHVDEALAAPGDVVVRPVPIRIPRRKTAPRHDAFDHEAKLVVTLSDEDPDTLENRVCLFRKPEMVVETVAEVIPGVTYHAFLAAGVAVAPGSGDGALALADDFLRFAEPPAHDLWIPRGSRAAQTSLGPNYVAPFRPNLEAIATSIRKELRELFGVVPPESDRPPEAVIRHLRFLARGTAPPAGRASKPSASLQSWRVNAAGQWEVSIEVEVPGRDGGWSFRPVVRFLAVEGGGDAVRWATLESRSAGCRVEGDLVFVEAGRRRVRRVVLEGTTDESSHPIPASHSAIDVVLRSLGQGDGASGREAS